MAKITAVSMQRSRAHAETQKRLGLKVGGTTTQYSVSDGSRTLTIDAWGPTPGERMSAAKKAFIQNSTYQGDHVLAVIRGGS